MIYELPKFRLTLTDNGISSLVEGLRRFTVASRPDGADNPADLKFAILLIAQAIELLLKARLAKAHPLLVFVDPGRPKGRTVDLPSLLDRLNAAGIETGASRAELIALQELRNEVQHSGPEADYETCTKKAGQGIRFLELFLKKELEISLETLLEPVIYAELQKAVVSYEEGLILAFAQMEAEIAALPANKREAIEKVQCEDCGNATVLYPDPRATAFAPNDVHCYFCETRGGAGPCPKCGIVSMGSCNWCDNDPDNY